LLASIQRPSHTSRPEMYGVSSPTPASFATARRSRPFSRTRAPSWLCSASSGLSTYLWAFVDGHPIVNAPRSLRDLPAETPLSRAI